VTSSTKYAKQKRSFLNLISLSLILQMLIGCGSPTAEELEAIDYTPLPGSDWEISTPAEQGLDPMLVAELYHNAEQLETLYGLLVLKNGHLVAEKYFHGKSVDQVSSRASVTKSITSALVGVALEQGCLSSVDSEDDRILPRTGRPDPGPEKDADHHPADATDARRISVGRVLSRAIQSHVQRLPVTQPDRRAPGARSGDRI
jgi:CubicO group peptidase (beta-lactamase class C family)